MPALLVVLAAMVIAVGGFIVAGNASKDDTSTGGCNGSMPVRLAVSPDLAPVLEKATRALETKGADADGVCLAFEVEPGSAASVADALAADPAAAPHLWVPDSSVWLARTATAENAPTPIAASLATTPVVVASTDPGTPASWVEVGKGTFAFLDPLTDSTGASVLLSAYSEMTVNGTTEAEMGAMVVPLAQRYAAREDKPETPADVARAAEQGGYGLMTEQQLVGLQHEGQAAALTATVPQTGTMLLDYPLAALSPEDQIKDAGSQLAAYLAGERGSELLAEHGFRDTKNTALASGEGLGQVAVTVLPAPEAEAVGTALRRWAVLSLPSRSIAVVDVSGSMDFTDGAGSRIELAVGAAGQALSLFPDNAQIGMWAFSIGLGGGNRDYLPMVPVRPLGPPDRPGGQRDRIAAAFAKLPGMTDGGTGLYDTTLAAVRTLQEGYDPAAVNSVILLTDGENEDPGSLSLQQLLVTLDRERDPARPVGVVAIGMGPEADAQALKRIAAATGGRSYVAREPADIGGVFLDAMLAR